MTTVFVRSAGLWTHWRASGGDFWRKVRRLCSLIICLMFVCCAYVNLCVCVSSEENTPLDLDDHGGRTFLRVLLHLTMHDYPPLVSRALHLLFRHFSQRQEVLQAFKQVFICLSIYFFIYSSILVFILTSLSISSNRQFIYFRFSSWWLVRMWTITSRSSQIWTSWGL